MTVTGWAQRLRLAKPAVLALGSNLGDRVAILRGALDVLRHHPDIQIRAVSPFYQTPALKLTGISLTAPAYLNAVALVDTRLDPEGLLSAVGQVENEFGRVREERWGDRTLDIDIIDFDGHLSDDPHLTLPHPRAHERAFVLVPWNDIDPHATLVGVGSVAELMKRVSDPVTRFCDLGEPQ